tara:strand:+ start:910 stop:1824 length:915 start_codon:yes stop_codon:yes gene_type:complete
MPAEVVDLNGEFDLGNSFTLETAQELSKIISDEYRIVIKYDLGGDMPKYNDNKLNIVLSTSRETHDVPNEFHRNDVFLIFQHYFMLDEWGYPMHNPLVYPMPLGPFRDISPDNIKPLHERKYDFCFVGQIPETGTRDCFKRNLDKLVEDSNGKFKFFIEYTDGFSQGLSAEDYKEVIADSKVCLCPQGAHSDETFRFFEAILMGSVPLVESLPRLWYYEMAPHFKGKWRDLDRTLSLVLNFVQTPKCRKFLYQIADYCNNILSPQNLAQHLKSKIEIAKSNLEQNKKPLEDIRKRLNELDANKL